jgi:uncharacterized membrane-anchored protein
LRRKKEEENDEAKAKIAQKNQDKRALSNYIIIETDTAENVSNFTVANYFMAFTKGNQMK